MPRQVFFEAGSEAVIGPKFHCHGVASRDLEEVVLRFDRSAKDLGVKLRFSVTPVITKVRTLFDVVVGCKDVPREAVNNLNEVRAALLKEGLIRL